MIYTAGIFQCPRARIRCSRSCVLNLSRSDPAESLPNGHSPLEILRSPVHIRPSIPHNIAGQDGQITEEVP